MKKQELKTGSFYWVKLKPYQDGHDETVTPGWEPMLRYSRMSWRRAGVIYRFPDDEIEEIGDELVPPKTDDEHDEPD